MKMKFAFVALACVVLSVCGCGFGSSPQNLIVGKWEAGQEGAKLKVEFSKDGKAQITMLGQPLQGTYKVQGDELEWTMAGKTTKYKVKVNQSALELTSEGKTITYKKV
jgi:uncharacterized protein (TIGR03066 family)